MKRLAPVVIAIFALSGFCGLVYELVWIRLLSQLLGGTTLAVSTVLAVFMGGLALGGIRFGRLADRHPDPLLLYARLELLIAVAGALVLPLLRLLQPAYVAVAHALPDWTLAGLRLGIAALLLLPATVLMGGTLPVLSRFLVRRADRLGAGVGLLYAVNTLGAVLGAGLTGFVLIERLGLPGSTALAVGGNLVAAGGALLTARALGPLGRPDAVADAPPAGANRRPRPVEIAPGVLAWIFAVSGFAALGYELYWTRALHHFLGNSTYAFSAMLTTYLAGLAGGGWVGGRLADRSAAPARLLGWVQVGIGLSAAATVPLIWNWLPRLQEAAFLYDARMALPVYLGRRFLVAFAIMAVPTFLSGMTFPLVTRIGVAGLEGLGRGVGRFYFANTAGAIVGSLAAGFLLLPRFGVRGALLGTAVLSAATGLAVLTVRRPRPPLEVAAAAAVLLALLLGAAPLVGRARVLLSDTQTAADRVLFDRQDPTADTRVYRKPDGELHMSVDGHHIGGTEPSITRKEKILAHLPLALVPRAETVLSVGLGSGVTLGSLSLYDEVRELTCIEIVPGVIVGARYFAAHNQRVLDDPRTRIVTGDGIQFLLTTRARFDVISSDSKLNPEFTGNASLLARDYYELCRDRLTPDGVMVQWLALHFPQAELRQVLRAFCEAFPHVEVFWIDPANLILAGSPRPLVLDLERAAALVAQPRVRADLTAMVLDEPLILPANRVAGRERLLAALQDVRPNTWSRPTLEFTLPRNFRRKSLGTLSQENFRLLERWWEREPMAVRGGQDPVRFERFRDSTRWLMGFYGGGADPEGKGRNAVGLAAAIAANPRDPRLTRLRDVMGRGPAAGTTADPAVRAQQLLDAGQPQAALQLIETAPTQGRGGETLAYLHALALLRAGRLEQAETEARAFVGSHPRHAEGQTLLGNVLAATGRFEEALAHHERATALDLANASSVYNLATTLARLERFGPAGERFAQAHGLDATLPNTAYFAAACFSRAGRTAEAARWMGVCLDEGMGDPQRFLEHAHFQNLRDSADWDAARVRRALSDGE